MIQKNLNLFDPSNMSAFGTLEVGELTPIIQLDWVYNYINTQTGASTIANSAVVDANGGRLRLQSGTNSAGSAIFNSRRIARYRAGQGSVARFTAAFTTGVAGNTQIVGVGTSVDGYFFGYNGTEFGICHRNSSSDTWIPRSSWNVDKLDSDGAFVIDPTKGNVYMIKYPFLGYGCIGFYVQNPTTSRWVLVHVITYPNTSITIQLTNPNLNFYAQSLNSGATTNQIIYVGSAGIFISGARSFISCPRWAIDNNKAAITAETNIFSIRNCTTFNGKTNRSLVRLQSLAVGSSNGVNSLNTIRLRIGATLGSTPTYTPINGSTADNGVTLTNANSICSHDVAQTTSTGGTLIYNIISGNNSNEVIDLTPFDLFIAPGEILTVAAFCTVSSSVACALNWTEDV